MIDKNIINYRCQDCDHKFYHKDETIESCPNCSSTLIDDLAFVAGAWLLCDWFGLWGDD